MNPQFPLYIPSKGRANSRLTIKSLEEMGVPYKVVIEQQEYEQYAAVVDKKNILVLDLAYKRNYDMCDGLGDAKSKGAGPARNFIWDHAIDSGFKWHWVMDDNIRGFYRLNKNLKVPMGDGTGFRCMEDFVLRYKNVGMAGPNYCMFSPRKVKQPPFITNTRIYSCNFIRNDIPFRWRGRYNEDTILSLDILKHSLCTIQFNAFLQNKIVTQNIPGGNTAEFYSKEGTRPKSEMLVKVHPDLARIVYKFGRWHHHVDYRIFKHLKLKKKADLEVSSGINNYGMSLKKLETHAD